MTWSYNISNYKEKLLNSKKKKKGHEKFNKIEKIIKIWIFPQMHCTTPTMIVSNGTNHTIFRFENNNIFFKNIIKIL